MIYLASPYSHPDAAVRQARYEAACRAAVTLLLAGHAVFSPIVHSHPLTAYGLPGDWSFWRQLDAAYLARCDELWVLMLDGWEQSDGVQAEIELAARLGKVVRYVEPEAVGVVIGSSAPAATTSHAVAQGAPEVMR